MKSTLHGTLPEWVFRAGEQDWSVWQKEEAGAAIIADGLTEGQAAHLVALRAAFLNAVGHVLTDGAQATESKAAANARFGEASSKVLGSALKEKRLRALLELTVGDALMLMVTDLDEAKAQMEVAGRTVLYEVSSPTWRWVRVRRLT